MNYIGIFGSPEMFITYVMIYWVLIRGLSIFLHVHIKSGFDFDGPAKWNAIATIRRTFLQNQLVCNSTVRKEHLFYLFNGQLFKRMPVFAHSSRFNEISLTKHDSFDSYLNILSFFCCLFFFCKGSTCGRMNSFRGSFLTGS